jgi:hypothetical protein
MHDRVRQYWYTFIIIMQYNMHHKRPLEPQRAKCTADPHPRRRPKQEAEGREPAAAGYGDRGAILVGAAISPPVPRRIIAQMLRACSIQTDRSQHHVVPALLQYEYAEESSLADGLQNFW